MVKPLAIAPPDLTDPATAELLARAARLLDADPAQAARLAREAVEAAGAEPAARAQAWLLCGQAAYRQGAPGDALEPLRQAANCLRAQGMAQGELEAQTALGRVQRELGDFAAAVGHFARAAELARELGQDAVGAEVLNLQAGIFHAQGEYGKALEALSQAREVVHRLGLAEKEANIRNNTGVILTVLGDYPRALEHLTEANAFVRAEAPGTRSEAANLGSIGNLYMETGDFAKALEFYSQALALAQAIQDRPLEVAALGNQAMARQRMGHLDEAAALFSQALRASRAAGLRQIEADHLDGLGQVHNAQGDPVAALAAHTEALAICREIGYQGGEVEALLSTARDYLALREPSSAVASLRTAIELAEKTRQRKAVFSAHELLADALEQLGRHREALEHHRRFHALERELFNAEAERKARNLGIQLELERARAEAETYRLRNELAQQARLEAEAKVWQRTRELENSQRDILNRLALAAEYRDDDTGEHTQRVGRNAALLAQALGLPEDECELVGFAARLHDVGKIGIPDAILLKPGKFSAPEFELMKSHAEIGAGMLSGGNSRLLLLAEEIARTHHERWNGQGYPRGLAGEEIPLVGRIVAVADVFDALTHQRPYKPAWSTADALAEIRRGGGVQFDPRVVEAAETVFGDPEFQNPI